MKFSIIELLKTQFDYPLLKDLVVFYLYPQPILDLATSLHLQSICANDVAAIKI